MKTMLSLMIGCLLCSFSLNSQRTISGYVTDALDGSAIPGVNVLIKGTQTGTVSDVHGYYSIQVDAEGSVLVFSFVGYETIEVRVKKHNEINVQMTPKVMMLQEQDVVGYRAEKRRHAKSEMRLMAPHAVMWPSPVETNEEEYAAVDENIFHNPMNKPLSTFSIDVDAASYSNVRRFIDAGQRPPKEAVRIEEMINYFDYDYEEPRDGHPFRVITEVAHAPWNDKHRLVHIGLQGKRIPVENLPASNLVFLIDVSGSMNHPNKLPLVKRSFAMLVEQLRPEDYVALVTSD